MMIPFRQQQPYGADELVRLVVTTDKEAMRRATLPLVSIDRYSGQFPRIAYRNRELRALAASANADDPNAEAVSFNNLRWPRPSIIPKRLVPEDIDALWSNSHIFTGESQQETEMSYFTTGVDEQQAEIFNNILWPRTHYRIRCWIWSFWQRHLKNWWLFIRYPLLVGAGLMYAIATAYHLFQSHGPTP